MSRSEISKRLTLSVDGMVYFSVTISRAPSRFPPCTMKYSGSRSSRAAIFPGSLVSVAENKSFWQEDSFRSARKDGTSGYGSRCRNAGATASWYGISDAFASRTSKIFSRSSESSVLGGGRVAANTCASQSWKDCASKRSASSMTCSKSFH